MRILLLGAGESGICFVERIREQNKDIEISIVDKNRYYYNKKDLLSLNLNNYFDLKDFAEKKNIKYIQGTVERINPKTKKVKLKDNNYIDFDILIIATGLISKKEDIKGVNKDGFFYLSDIEPFTLKDYLKISKEISIYTCSFLGLRLALSLSKINKEVNLIFKDLNFLEDYKDRLIEFLNSNNIKIYTNSYIEEIIGEGNIKAVKILPLKIFSSQLVFFDGGFLQNIDFFDEPVKRKDIFFTEYNDIYLLGDVNRTELDYFYAYNQIEAKRQALVLADFILGGSNPIFSFKKLDYQDKIKVIEDFLNRKE